MIKSFWQGRRVFLTGHTGFKGSWLSLWLQSLGAELTGYALSPPTNPSLFEGANVASGMNSIIGDVRDIDTLQKAIKEAKPEIVIHMAAQPLVRYSYTNPVETYATNVMGSVNLLESIRHVQNIKAVINITSDKCYENREWVWGYREDEAMGGYDPYSNSKGCAELVTAAYRSSFFNPNEYVNHGVALASARAGNVIGGGDWAGDRLIPDFIRAFHLKETAVIRCPNAIRPWQHVLEPLSGYLLLAEKLYEGNVAFAESWNFGPNDDDAQPVSCLAQKFIELWGDGANFKVDENLLVHEANYLKLDISKAKSKLGWVPTLRLDDSLGMVVDWNKRRMSGESEKNITLDQIRQFEVLVGKKQVKDR